MADIALWRVTAVMVTARGEVLFFYDEDELAEVRAALSSYQRVYVFRPEREAEDG